MAHFSELRNSKALLRREIKSRLAGTTDAEISRQDDAINTRLLDELRSLPPSSTVLMFSPIRFEPRIDRSFAACLSAGHRLALPRITNAQAGEMMIHQVEAVGTLTPGPFGIAEPDPDFCPPLDVSTINVALIPGWAFDPKTGDRLGKGGGFYDRMLASPEFRARMMGVGYSDQLVGDLPTEGHDHPLDAILTPIGMTTIDRR